MPFATIDRASGRAVGSTRYMSIVPEHRRLEIGWTWLAPPWQRTGANREAKLLMLAHAFDVMDVHRVVLNTDARNERSRAAIARIGATFEGVLHGFRYGVEGTPRDTATFAIRASEWPEVRARLEARVNATQ
jgi:RimJ/RimL family protein N-acetyltransferase